MAAARDLVARGFRCLKLKGGLDVDEDVCRVLKVREAVGTETELRFDANQGCTVSQSLDFVEATRELTGGRGVDLVVDSIGGKTLEGSIQAAAYRGRIIFVGSAGRDDTRPDPALLRPGNKTLTGVFLGAELVLHADRVYPMIAGHLEGVARGDLEIVIDRRYPLAEASAAHAYIEGRHAFGRVLLIP